MGKDAFQEADITGITLPVTKHNYKVMEPDEIPTVVAEAFHIASTGRPGPVLIDVPKDVLQAPTAFEWPRALDIPGYRPNKCPHGRQVRAAADLIAASERPVIYVGGGVLKAGAIEELRAFAELLGAPVVTTLMARGAFPDARPFHPSSMSSRSMWAERYLRTGETLTPGDLHTIGGCEVYDYKVVTERSRRGSSFVQAIVEVRVGSEYIRRSGYGVGPVHALDNALRLCLADRFPEIDDLRLSDYRVTVVDASAATGAEVQVTITATDGIASWDAGCVSANIIDASLEALRDTAVIGIMRGARSRSRSRPHDGLSSGQERDRKNVRLRAGARGP